VHFADDTTVPVLAPGKGRTDTGRLWVVLRDEAPWCGSAPPAAFYRYSRDRKAEQAEARCAFQAIVITDSRAS